VSIRDPQTNALQPPGAVGEILARGFGVMLGYNDDPEATSKAIDPEGWLRTGDLGTLDACGRLRITGRVKEMQNRAERVWDAPVHRFVSPGCMWVPSPCHGRRLDAHREPKWPPSVGSTE
jgi:hypothetical protein